MFDMLLPKNPQLDNQGVVYALLKWFLLFS